MNRTTNSASSYGISSWLHRRIGFLLAVLLFGGFITARGTFSQATQQQNFGSSALAVRRAINLPGKPELPFSDGILAGNTLYLAGRLGVDPQTGKPPAEIEAEVKFMLDGIKAVLGQAGMTMDDLVYVQIASTDLSLFDKFNGIYRGYFTAKDLPAREFIGAGSLLRGAHFELQAIAVKR